jgi:putative addiction module component (TIGR02574 family)
MRDTEKLLTEVLELPAEERAEVAAKIIRSLDAGGHDAADADDIDEAWARELERRAAAVDSGQVVTSDWEVLRKRIERDIFGR